jgi:transaldolase
MNEAHMNPMQKLHHDGQSLWLDNITRDLLTSVTLQRYIDELGITGLTSNPTIFDQAFLNTAAYDVAIRGAADRGLSGEEIFFSIALEDLQAAADLFRDIHERTHRLYGWVSLEVSPEIADDADRNLRAAVELHRRAARPNLFVRSARLRPCWSAAGTRRPSRPASPTSYTTGSGSRWRPAPTPCTGGCSSRT